MPSSNRSSARCSGDSSSARCQVLGGEAGGAVGHRARGGLAEDAHRVLVAGRRAHQDVGGHLLGRAAGLGEHPRRLRVRLALLEGAEAGIDGGTHDRVHERDPFLRVQELDLDERARGPRGRVAFDACQGGGVLEQRAVAEHARGARERDRLVGQAREPQAHGAADGLGADLVDAGALVGAALDALRCQGARELGDEQRVAAARGVAGVAELVRRLGREALARADDAWRRGESATGASTCAEGSPARVSRIALSKPGSCGREASTSSTGSPSSRPADVLERGERGRVAPVQVVDEERERGGGRQVRSEPVEPVVDGEGAARRRPLTPRAAARRGPRRRRRARPAPPRRAGRRAARRAGVPPRTRTPAPCRSRAPTGSASAAAAARSRASARSRVLPIPGEPSTSTSRPSPAATSPSSAAELVLRAREAPPQDRM